MNTYKLSDLYIAAYLKSIWYEYTIESTGKRCFFSFDEKARDEVQNFVQNSNRSNFNVNASIFTNEIKQLKAYVNNL